MKTAENTLHDTTESPAEGGGKQGLEISPSSESGSLQERLEALHSAIGHDDPITAEHLDDLHGAVQGMKINIGGKEVSLKDAEGLATINTFLGETNKGWGVKEEDLPTFKVEFVSPTDLDYKEKAEHPDTAKFGGYSLNPETFGVDFEKSKVFIPDLSSMNGKKLYEVFQHVVETYGAKYHIPGIEYWKWMIENPDKAEEAAKKQEYDIKDGNYYYFPGSSLCNSSGDWLVPYSRWNGGEFYRGARWLGPEWDSHDRVLLLEK
jgi:hypothetical protein